MAEVSVSKRYEVPAADMWKRIGDPADINRWHPAIEATELTNGGNTRLNSLAGGGLVSETILEHGERHHTYRIDDSPLPMEGFTSTIHILDEEDAACVVRWDATFDVAGISDDEGEELVRAFFQAGLDAL